MLPNSLPVALPGFVRGHVAPSVDKEHSYRDLYYMAS